MGFKMLDQLIGAEAPRCDDHNAGYPIHDECSADDLGCRTRGAVTGCGATVHNLAVLSQGCWVLLRGEVENLADYGLVDATARSVPGVAGLTNLLGITPSPPSLPAVATAV